MNACISRFGITAVIFLLTAGVEAAQPADSQSAGVAPRYTFSWPLDSTTLAPRGGTTKGPPVELDTQPSAAWVELQKPGTSAFDRDRQAILAMAGTYRVNFDFLEVVPFVQRDKPFAPYQSWGTEKIYVDIDTGNFISLVHILEMRIVMKDGSISEPMVTKHWRQDWRYEPEFIVEHKGRDRWQRRRIDSAQGKQAWSQTVYQVDESPRYASIGRWQHTASFSSWLSGETWRPLPRREWSVRDDYQVLIGTNRHTVFATGWVQEENNLKTVLAADRTIAAAGSFVAREYGVARYERIRGTSFADADEYYESTRRFWDEVRDEWVDVFENQGTVTLRGPVDKLGLFQPLFARAEEIQQSGARAGDNRKIIREALRAMGVE